MTKAEQADLHALKCKMQTVRPNMGDGPETLHILQLSLTSIELAAVVNALSEYGGNESDKVLSSMQLASEKAGIRL